MTQPTPSSARMPWPVFFVAVAGAFVVALDLSIVNVAFPSIGRSFPGASTSTLSWVLTAYSVVFGALLLGAGRIADRSGRRRWFLRGVAVFTLGSLLCGIATAPWMLIGGRVVQAVGAALLMPASLAILLAATAAELRPQAVAMWGGISALAVATGPSLGAVLIDAGGWRWAFFINLPVLLAVGLATRRVVTETVVGGPPPDLLGVATLSVAVGALALGITQGEDWGWSSAAVLGALAAAAVLGVAAVRRARVHPAPAIDLSLFSNRTVALANAATVAYAVGFFAMLLANVLFLTEVWGYSTLKAGLAITPGPLVVAALSRSTGALAARLGYRPVLVGGSLVFAAAQLWSVGLMPLEPDYLGRWLPASLLTGLGVALTFPVLSAAAVAGLPPERFGVGGAVNQTARQMGAVLGIALLVAVLGTPASPADALDAFQRAWLLCAVAAVVSAAISLRHTRLVRVAPEPALAAEVVPA
ncbi:MAG TPA: MFS transporter [Acidimicrobiales bacterium]|nr:MFS transporter [Acidimicrobiales bacterium]